jgi:hypothetical protein
VLPDVLYVFDEAKYGRTFNQKHQQLRELPMTLRQDRSLIAAHNTYPFNTGFMLFKATAFMETLFASVLRLLDTYNGYAHYEQPHINYVFSLFGALDRSLITEAHMYMSCYAEPEPNMFATKYVNKIVHLCNSRYHEKLYFYMRRHMSLLLRQYHAKNADKPLPSSLQFDSWPPEQTELEYRDEMIKQIRDFPWFTSSGWTPS